MQDNLAPSLSTQQISSLPLWQRRILAHVQAGLSINKAAAAINVSPGSWQQASRDNPVFAQALLEIEAGATLLGVDEARNLAIARASKHMDALDAFVYNRDPETGETMEEPITNKEGDVVGYRPLARITDRIAAVRANAEVAGAIDRGTKVTVATQVNVVGDYEAKVRQAAKGG